MAKLSPSEQEQKRQVMKQLARYIIAIKVESKDETSRKAKKQPKDMHLADVKILRFAAMETDRFVVIDTETTGLKPNYDEVLSLAIVDQDGNAIFNHLIKPEKRRRWPKATEINGITWQDVKDKETLKERSYEIERILASANLIVGYNLEYDLGMLRAGGIVIPIRERFDLMGAFAKAYGEWADWKGDYKWMKLTECAAHYGYEFEAHDALNDAKATAFCYKAFIGECREAKNAIGSTRVNASTMPDTTNTGEQARPPKSSSVGTVMGFIVAFALLIGIISSFVSGYILSILIIVAIAAFVLAKAK